MGRKIPAKKHRGVKDPIKQQQQRLYAIKDKINAPPTNPDDQPIPKSFTRLFEYKERHEQKLKKKPEDRKKRKINCSDSDDDTKHGNPVAKMKRLPSESNRSFMLRINNAVQGINNRQLQTAEMERSLNPDKYVQEEEKVDRFEIIERKKLKKKLKKKNTATEDDTPKLTRMQKWTLHKKLKKERKEERRIDESAPRYETVKFGEVAHAPPTLTIKPRRATTLEGAPRPGRKDLLLNKILLGDFGTTDSTKDARPITVNAAGTTFNKKAKRKALPLAVRLRLEQSQQEAIDAYKALKLAKIKENVTSKS